MGVHRRSCHAVPGKEVKRETPLRNGERVPLAKRMARLGTETALQVLVKAEEE
jgi:hypothetical protein